MTSNDRIKRGVSLSSSGGVQVASSTLRVIIHPRSTVSLVDVAVNFSMAVEASLFCESVLSFENLLRKMNLSTCEKIKRTWVNCKHRKGERTEHTWARIIARGQNLEEHIRPAHTRHTHTGNHANIPLCPVQNNKKPNRTQHTHTHTCAHTTHTRPSHTPIVFESLPSYHRGTTRGGNFQEEL